MELNKTAVPSLVVYLHCLVVAERGIQDMYAYHLNERRRKTLGQ